MEKIRTIKGYAVLVLAASLLAVSPPILADGVAARMAATGTEYRDSIEPPRLVQRYRSALGLKPSQSDATMLGRGSATTQLLARYARTAETPAPLWYAYEPVPSGPGLRSSAQTAGVVVRGGEGWSASFESSTSTDMLAATRRTSLLTQLHAPLAGGAGISVGLRYSALQGAAYAWGSSDTPPLVGYTLPPGILDSIAQQFGYQVQLNYVYGERNTIALTYNSRRELDPYAFALDPFGSEGRQLSLTGEHWFSPSWALRYDIGAPELGNLMRRQGLRLGVRYRF